MSASAVQAYVRLQPEKVVNWRKWAIRIGENARQVSSDEFLAFNSRIGEVMQTSPRQQ